MEYIADSNSVLYYVTSAKLCDLWHRLWCPRTQTSFLLWISAGVRLKCSSDQRMHDAHHRCNMTPCYCVVMAFKTSNHSSIFSGGFMKPYFSEGSVFTLDLVHCHWPWRLIFKNMTHQKRRVYSHCDASVFAIFFIRILINISLLPVAQCR